MHNQIYQMNDKKKILENVITGSKEIFKWMLDCSGRC